MRRSVAILLGVLAPLASGCDSASFVPPPPPELKSIPDPSFEPAVKIVEMVLGSSDARENESWAQTGRMDSGVAKVSFRSSALAAGDPPQRQAELIRKAAARGASALIVVPEPDPQVAQALQEVKAKGTAVVLLARPLSGHEQEFPLVALEAPAKAADSLVKAAIEDAQAAKLPKDGTAIIIAPKNPDVLTDSEIAALKTSIGHAGLATPDVLTYDGTQPNVTKLVEERIKSDPKLTFVFTVDSPALYGVQTARTHVFKERPFIVAGFSELDPHQADSLYAETAAIADRDTTKMVHTAFRLAARLANGEQVESPAALPIPFQRYSSRAPADRSTPRDPTPK